MTTAINLSIVSHTNIGKTTLTRTLLSRDVGEVADRAHVTVSCDPYTLAKTADGAELILWDTPGFGNSVALAKRLEGRSNPLGWFMSEVWDRAVNKSQWINQQALLHVKDTSSVVLYLVNADQLPDTTPYVTAEMQILEWLEKPVIVLLNQLGEPKSAREENQLVARWKQALEGFPIVKTVLAMDAFARCWVQEYSLFDAVGDALPDNLKAAFAELKNEWLTGRRAAYDQSTAALSRFMNDRVNDTEVVTVIPLAKRLKLFGKSVGLLKSKTPAPDTSDAQKTLSQKADEAFQDLAQELLSINGLSGTVEPQTLFARMETVWTPRAKVSGAKAGLAGAIGAGAAGGLSADIAAGGLTFGAGALIGAMVGAVGAMSAAGIYNKKKNADGAVVTWSDTALTRFLAQSLLLYLAVAHFGRGRGVWEENEAPAVWQETVMKAMKLHPTEREFMATAVRPLTDDILSQLYPGVKF